MVEKIVSYRAWDGSIWNTGADADKREQLLAEVYQVMLPLGQSPKLADGESVPVDRKMLFSVRRSLYEIVKREFLTDSHLLSCCGDVVHPRSIVGRILCDSGNGPVQDAWGRLGLFNFDYCREFDQAYYAINPQEADGFPWDGIKTEDAA